MIFEDPPEIDRVRPDGPKHTRIAAALRDRPGEWAIVKTTLTHGAAAAAAHQIKTGRLSAYAPEGSFDAVSRTVEGKHTVYAKYLGAV